MSDDVNNVVIEEIAKHSGIPAFSDIVEICLNNTYQENSQLVAAILLATHLSIPVPAAYVMLNAYAEWMVNDINMSGW
jgi:hypothetical protein